MLLALSVYLYNLNVVLGFLVLKVLNDVALFQIEASVRVLELIGFISFPFPFVIA